jgi:hypothetical protein
MASNSNPRPKLRALAPKTPADSEASPLSSRAAPDDVAAGTPVTMPNEPYRSLAQRLDSPDRHLTIEQRVDTRLCVSALTPKQCRDVLMQLDDKQVKNAVYDRTLCFPFEQWTQDIRAIYGRQVQEGVQVANSFANVIDQMYNKLTAWREAPSFTEADLDNFETLVKGFVSPSIDNIGVYGTYSHHTVTKVNALAALLKIGEFLVSMPILSSERGLALFEYDPLSRAGKSTEPQSRWPCHLGHIQPQDGPQLAAGNPCLCVKDRLANSRP